VVDESPESAVSIGAFLSGILEVTSVKRAS
jgi:hypothetical protein